MTQQFKFGDKFKHKNSGDICLVISDEPSITDDGELVWLALTEDGFSGYCSVEKMIPQENGWISVQDELPEIGITVLACTETSQVFASWIIEADEIWFYHEKAADRVTHWQPMPPPFIK